MPTSTPPPPAPAATQVDPSSPTIPTNKRWGPRRRGACGMCKIKKVRCDGATPCQNCKRHNQECQYQLPKKRHACNKSVGSVSSEKAPENRSYRDEIRDSIADILGEPPNVAQLSPELAVSSNGRVSCSTEGSNSNLQEVMMATDDGHIVQGFPDAYHDNASWTACMDWAGSQNLRIQPSVSGSSAHGSGVFYWPSSTTNTDSDFYLDTPFSVDHTDSSTALSSTAQSELEFPRFSNGRSHDHDTTKCWGDLLSYLSFDDKLPKGSFPDHVPSIDFSLAAMFSLQDRALENISNAKQDEIDRIFKRISHTQAQTPTDLGDEEGHGNWYWSDRAMMESCRVACFREPLGISNFLTRSCFDNYVREARSSSEESSKVIPLINSVMAFGFQALLATSQQLAGSDERNKAIRYSKAALQSRENILRSPDTLLKLQTILAMATISDQIDDSIYTELLAGAVSCARALRLVNRDLIHNKTASKEEQYLARRSLWYLYSIEVPHSLRFGIPSALDHDWIDHAPPQASSETDWLPFQCQYANALSSAAEMLYNQKALHRSLEEREQYLDMAYNMLETWRLSLPVYLQDIHKPDMGGRTLEDHRLRHLALSMVRKYHEAIFIIYFPWTGSQSRVMISECCRRRSMELCVNSAQAVLAIATKISRLDMLDSKFLSLISVSICITFLDMVSGSGSKKSIPYLGMGCGIYGRLSVDIELPLAEVLELTRIAQRL